MWSASAGDTAHASEARSEGGVPAAEAKYPRPSCCRVERAKRAV